MNVYIDLKKRRADAKHKKTRATVKKQQTSGKQEILFVVFIVRIL